jgi:hypothetical protein
MNNCAISDAQSLVAATPQSQLHWGSAVSCRRKPESDATDVRNHRLCCACGPGSYRCRGTIKSARGRRSVWREWNWMQTFSASWAERTYHKLIYYNRVDKGGHYAAWEQPQLFSQEVRATFKSLRA